MLLAQWLALNYLQRIESGTVYALQTSEENKLNLGITI